MNHRNVGIRALLLTDCTKLVNLIYFCVCYYIYIVDKKFAQKKSKYPRKKYMAVQSSLSQLEVYEDQYV